MVRSMCLHGFDTATILQADASIYGSETRRAAFVNTVDRGHATGVTLQAEHAALNY